MMKIVFALAVVAAVSATSIYENDMSDQSFSVMAVNKNMQWSECNTKTFATVFDAVEYNNDMGNVAKYCAHYCRTFVDDDTTHVNIDDRTDTGGSYACYCSSDCSGMCEGTPAYETVSLGSSSTTYSPLAFYYNTYYYFGSYSSYGSSWTFPYMDDSQSGQKYNYDSEGPNSGYYMYYYYYYGTQYGSVSYTLSGTDYAQGWVEGTSESSTEVTVWTMDCDSGDDMDFVNDKIADMTADYNIIMDTDDDVDFSTLTYEEAVELNSASGGDAKCMPVWIFQYGAFSLPGGVPDLDYDKEEGAMGLDPKIRSGVTDICGQFTDRDYCEGFKMYGYGGYTCTEDDDSNYSSSENFGYSYYYDGNSIYHGDESNCFDFDWQLHDQSYYGTTFTYYYYYYYSYIYVCDWTYNYDQEETSDIHNMVFAEFSLYAILDA